MKVLHINCNYFGHNPVHRNMISYMEKIKNLDNYVFCPVTDTVSEGVSDNVVASRCIKRFDRLFFHNKSKKIRSSLINTFNIESFDLMHAYTVFTDGNVAYELNKKYNIPYVVAVRNTDVNTFFKYMVHLRKRGVEILQNASAIFFLSKSYQNFVINKYIPDNIRKKIEEKSFIIPNGINEFWLKNINNNSVNNKIEDFKNKTLKLVYAGDIDKNKNLIFTCKTIDLLKNKGWNVEYNVAGRIRDKKIFEKIKKYINYKGILKKEELLDLYRDSHIFIMPSIAETFGIVYAEAISQGVPVIYTKGQGFDEQFDNGKVGFAVDINNENEADELINKIIKKYKSISNNCISLVKKFEWEKIICQYFQEYKRIIGEDVNEKR